MSLDEKNPDESSVVIQRRWNAFGWCAHPSCQNRHKRMQRRSDRLLYCMECVILLEGADPYDAFHKV